MGKNEVLQTFHEVAANPYDYASEWKRKNNKKVIGCYPMYTPEEIVHAGGMLPTVMLGNDEPPTGADNHIQVYFCEAIRSAIHLGDTGKWSYLDGILFPDICDPIRGLGETWSLERFTDFSFNIRVPVCNNKSISRRWYIDELNRLREALERIAGKPITDDAIEESIKVYNENRSLLQKLYDIRRQNPYCISANELGDVVVAAMTMPKEEHSKLLQELIVDLENEKRPDAVSSAIPVVLFGSLCDRPSEELIDLIQESGAIIVDDDLYTGSRYFIPRPRLNVPPIEALVDQHFNMIPCTSRHKGAENRIGEYELSLVKKSGAAGVITIMLKYCEPHCFDEPRFANFMAKAGVPTLLIEVDQEAGTLGQIKTRLQAFIEMLQAAA